MKRHYYISDNLDDLEVTERQMEAAGVSTPQIHVLSNDEAGLEAHQLHQVEAVLKQNVVRGTELGAVVGMIGAVATLALWWMFDVPESYTWIPVIFLAIIVLGFCTWEGGLIGIQQMHVDFRRFRDDLEQGKHVLFVDFDADQEQTINAVVAQHPRLVDAGEGESTPRWVIAIQNRFHRGVNWAP